MKFLSGPLLLSVSAAAVSTSPQQERSAILGGDITNPTITEIITDLEVIFTRFNSKFKENLLDEMTALHYGLVSIHNKKCSEFKAQTCAGADLLQLRSALTTTNTNLNNVLIPTTQPDCSNATMTMSQVYGGYMGIVLIMNRVLKDTQDCQVFTSKLIDSVAILGGAAIKFQEHKC